MYPLNNSYLSSFQDLKLSISFKCPILGKIITNHWMTNNSWKFSQGTAILVMLVIFKIKNNRKVRR